ncbi:MAG: DUF3524 domain-containing protein [Anaerolineae bacterium]
MKICLLEPYYTGSHQSWANGYAAHSRHQVRLLTLPGRFWKWRMHGGAVSLARQFMALPDTPELLLATDMLDLTTFLALTRRRTAGIPTAIYFHENQLTYPWSPTDRDISRQRDKHYGFINYASALAADAVFFNSQYHRDSFLQALPRLLKHFPDFNELESVRQIEAKSRVLPLGLNLGRFDAVQPKAPQPRRVPLVLWNHRWEYDKNPADFFEALKRVAAQGLEFEVALLGENFSRQPAEFLQARAWLGQRVVQFGYADSFADYAQWLWRADLLPVTSNQDFFGASVIQAIYCGCVPLLPRRLAYPELLPPALHQPYFYDDFEGLVARLAAALADITPLRREALRNAAARFDWQVLAPTYDEMVEALI